MAAKAYKINDRRGQGGGHFSTGGNNSLYRAATQSNDRETTPNLSFDSYRNVSKYGYRQLRNVGRFLFANCAPVKGALLEQAELSVGHFIPQFVGSKKFRDWGKLAEKWLMDWHRIMDIRGWPYDSGTYLRNLIVGVRRDGDHFTLLTETEDGYPLVQVIGPHRIYSDCEKVIGGPFDGYSIFNGVIVDDYGRTVGYRIYDDGCYTGNNYRDISANDGFLIGFPEYCDQYRFDSSLATPACDWQDVFERRKFEMLAQKIGSTIGLIETNELGEPMPGQGAFTRATSDTTTTAATGISTQTLEGGLMKYFRANSGSKLETIRFDRPSADSQAFEAAIIRGAFRGMEWEVDFSLDASKVGGASMRVVIEKINTTIRKNQMLAEKAMRRIDGFALSKAIKLGLLPQCEEWYAWEFQGPGEVTADRKYDSDVDIQEINSGIGNRKNASARRGKYWEDNDLQRELEVDSDFERADRLAKKWNVSIELAITMLRPPTPNGLQANPQQANEERQKQEEEEDRKAGRK